MARLGGNKGHAVHGKPRTRPEGLRSTVADKVLACQACASARVDGLIPRCSPRENSTAIRVT